MEGICRWPEVDARGWLLPHLAANRDERRRRLEPEVRPDRRKRRRKRGVEVQVPRLPDPQNQIDPLERVAPVEPVAQMTSRRAIPSVPCVFEDRVSVAVRVADVVRERPVVAELDRDEPTSEVAAHDSRVERDAGHPLIVGASAAHVQIESGQKAPRPGFNGGHGASDGRAIVCQIGGGPWGRQRRPEDEGAVGDFEYASVSDLHRERVIHAGLDMQQVRVFAGDGVQIELVG